MAQTSPRKRQEPDDTNEWMQSEPLLIMQLLYESTTYAAFKPPVPITKEWIHSHMAQGAGALSKHLGYIERPGSERAEEAG